MLKTKSIKMIDNYDWDKLVQETYGKPYCFQQQHGCQSRGIFNLSIPVNYTEDDEMYDASEIPEIANGSKMGVKFSDWLARDAKKPLANGGYDFEIISFWERKFYPDIYTLADDLYKKGLIETGEYVINIDN